MISAISRNKPEKSCGSVNAHGQLLVAPTYLASFTSLTAGSVSLGWRSDCTEGTVQVQLGSQVYIIGKNFTKAKHFFFNLESAVAKP